MSTPAIPGACIGVLVVPKDMAAAEPTLHIEEEMSGFASKRRCF